MTFKNNFHLEPEDVCPHCNKDFRHHSKMDIIFCASALRLTKGGSS